MSKRDMTDTLNILFDPVGELSSKFDEVDSTDASVELQKIDVDEILNNPQSNQDIISSHNSNSIISDEPISSINSSKVLNGEEFENNLISSQNADEVLE